VTATAINFDEKAMGEKVPRRQNVSTFASHSLEEIIMKTLKMLTGIALMICALVAKFMGNTAAFIPALNVMIGLTAAYVALSVVHYLLERNKLATTK
jgi:hypothetical protein